MDRRAEPRARAWSGRMGEPPTASLEGYTSSAQSDLEFAAEDIRGSRAHARTVGAAGLLSDPELKAIEQGLRRISEELASASFELLPVDEDVHMAVERRLTELIGEPGQRLHAGRSRNDQVALDLRLWCRAQIVGLAGELCRLQGVLLRRAAVERETLLPGYTHLQRAQPVQLGHHLLAYFEMLQRDLERLEDCWRRTDSSPLGAGALAGNTLGLDREAAARDLGLGSISRNSLDAVSDRDFAVELLFDCALLAVHLSRLAEELILWNTEEFGFITLPDRWATGSSLMPQKKNPDVLELARARASRPMAALMALLTVLKGLPLSYNRDLQEDKEQLFPAVRSTRATVVVLGDLISAVRFRRQAMAAAASDPRLLATDLAERLVLRGVPFREAHRRVAALIHRLDQGGGTLESVPESEWEQMGFDSAAEAQGLLDPRRSLEARESPGSPGPQATAAALSRARRRLEANRRRVRRLGVRSGLE